MFSFETSDSIQNDIGMQFNFYNKEKKPVLCITECRRNGVISRKETQQMVVDFQDESERLTDDVHYGTQVCLTNFE